LLVKHELPELEIVDTLLQVFNGLFDRGRLSIAQRRWPFAPYPISLLFAQTQA